MHKEITQYEELLDERRLAHVKELVAKLAFGMLLEATIGDSSTRIEARECLESFAAGLEKARLAKFDFPFKEPHQ